MYLFFSRFSKLSARKRNSRFFSSSNLPRYSMAETLSESPGVSYLDQFESNQASALTDLTGTARRGDSRFFSSSTLPRYSIAETLRESPGASSLDGFGSTKASAPTVLTGTARREYSRFLSLLTLPRYSMAGTLRQSPGVSSLDGFGSTKASALTVLTGTARRGNSRFFSSRLVSSKYPFHLKSFLPLAVTNLTSALWCEFQYLFGCYYGKTNTEAMKRGRHHHSHSSRGVPGFGGTYNRRYSSRDLSHKGDPTATYEFNLNSGVTLFAIRKAQEFSETSISEREETYWSILTNFLETSDEMLRFEFLEDILANWMCKSIQTIQHSEWETDVPKEVFIIALIEDEFVYGLVDYIKWFDLRPQLVELKLRISKNEISKAQLAINKFQVHMYQLIWDSSREKEFPVNLFLKRYGFNPNHLVSCEIPEAKALGLQTFSDVLHRLKNVLKSLPAASNPILRYEYTWKDEITEYLDPPEGDSVMLTYKKSLEFFRGLRSGELTKDEWKCNFCEFRKRCPRHVGETDEPALRRRK